MPARINKIRHDENTRAKIQVAKILNLLHEHLEGMRKLESTQLKAAEILLSKALPSLQSVELSGEITTSKVIRAPALAISPTTWADEHVPKQHIN